MKVNTCLNHSIKGLPIESSVWYCIILQSSSKKQKKKKRQSWCRLNFLWALPRTRQVGQTHRLRPFQPRPWLPLEPSQFWIDYTKKCNVGHIYHILHLYRPLEGISCFIRMRLKALLVIRLTYSSKHKPRDWCPKGEFRSLSANEALFEDSKIRIDDLQK